MVTGFTVTVKIGVNALSKEEAKKIVEQWIKPIEAPIWIENVEH